MFAGEPALQRPWGSRGWLLAGAVLEGQVDRLWPMGLLASLLKRRAHSNPFRQADSQKSKPGTHCSPTALPSQELPTSRALCLLETVFLLGRHRTRHTVGLQPPQVP